MRHGLPTTSALRTVVDLAGRDPITEGVVAADLALRAGLVSITQLNDYVEAHPKAGGIARLRRVVDLAEPLTESPMETRLRILLVNAGLPRPEAQVRLRDEEGRFLGRPDLLYRRQRLVLEYDGGNHRDRMVDDNHRQNCLVAAGFRLLRFTATDVYRTPEEIIANVRRELFRS